MFYLDVYHLNIHIKKLFLKEIPKANTGVVREHLSTICLDSKDISHFADMKHCNSFIMFYLKNL